jgi:saccharopine dehydrogenase (NAD+, L-lysine-forming)
MPKLVVIGAGSVGRVVVDRCTRKSKRFSEVLWINRSEQRLREASAGCSGVQTLVLDADDTTALSLALSSFEADIVIHAALPYQNLSIMRACLEAGAHYIDTSVPESPDELWADPREEYWYGQQWELGHRYESKGLCAVLSAGSDPGLVNAFCRLAADELFDEVSTIDIVDVNAGKHGLPFATNFNAEINLREVQCPVWHQQNGEWLRSGPFENRWDYDFPEVGVRPLYLMDHDELHSLCRRFPRLEHLKFWMGFSDTYVDTFKKLEAIGLLRHDPIEVRQDDGRAVQVPPLRVLSELLPDPTELSESYQGTVVIGVELSGNQGGRQRRVLVYSTCSHEHARVASGTQAIAFFAGVPPVAAAELILDGIWRVPGVHNVEDLPARPFLDALPALELHWHVVER